VGKIKARGFLMNDTAHDRTYCSRSQSEGVESFFESVGVRAKRSLQLSSSTDELILSKDDSEVEEVVDSDCWGRGSLAPVQGWGDQSWGAGKVEWWGRLRGWLAAKGGRRLRKFELRGKLAPEEG